METTTWIPYHEYLAYQDMLSKMSVEEYNKMGYFFWNNFSMEGYDEWVKTNQNKNNG